MYPGMEACLFLFKDLILAESQSNNVIMWFLSVSFPISPAHEKRNLFVPTSVCLAPTICFSVAVQYTLAELTVVLRHFLSYVPSIKFLTNQANINVNLQVRKKRQKIWFLLFQ